MRPTILIIDDSATIRKTLAGVLKDDFDVQLADSGESGLLAAIATPPSLVIIDVEMPTWDGLKTLQVFRNYIPLQDVHVIMLTGNSKRDTVVAAIEAGAQDYVLKPQFNRDEFLEKVRRALKMPRPSTASVANRDVPGCLAGTLAREIQTAIDSWE